MSEYDELVKIGRCRGYKNPEQWAEHLLKGRSKMKIEAGKYYKTRDGQKIGPMMADSVSTLAAVVNGGWKSFFIQNGINLHDSNLDLISEWPDTEHVSAANVLTKAAYHMKERASTYDNPQGERSMAKTVEIFNLHHGTSLTAAQGWHFMQILKDVRLFSHEGYHADSAEDCVAYAALKAEALNES